MNELENLKPDYSACVLKEINPAEVPQLIKICWEFNYRINNDGR